jgi:putative addiction module component (TIGR02574 family)
MTFAEIVLDLSPTQRLTLVNLLVDSLPDYPRIQIEASWAEEIERRAAEVDAGETRLIS